MFVTRASRRDRSDVEDFYGANSWQLDLDLSEGVAFVARQGPVIGCVRLFEVAPQTLVLEDVLVAEAQRGKGIGRQLVRAAMNSRGGSMYLCCHEEREAFYSHFGFEPVPFEDLPDAVQELMRRTGGWPTEPGHVHLFMKAR